MSTKSTHRLTICIDCVSEEAAKAVGFWVEGALTLQRPRLLDGLMVNIDTSVDRIKLAEGFER